MRARWTQRRAWAVWVLASLLAWIAIGALFTALLKDDAPHAVINADRSPASDIAPASGSSPKQSK